jgi:hypothetical protein
LQQFDGDASSLVRPGHDLDRARGTRPFQSEVLWLQDQFLAARRTMEAQGRVRHRKVSGFGRKRIIHADQEETGAGEVAMSRP